MNTYVQKTTAKKRRGQFYTPLAVAERMLAMLRWPEPIGSAVLLDPACGDGVFLEAAIRKVVSLDLPRTTTEAVIAKSILGWDIDREALGAARKRLRRVFAELKQTGSLPRLAERDSVDAVDARFQAVVGNPPYLEAKRMPIPLKRWLKERCSLAARGAFDLYTAFVERALEWTVDGGEFCLLIPNRFLVTAHAEALRQRLLETRHVTVVDLSKEKIFDDATVYPVIVRARCRRKRVPIRRTVIPVLPRQASGRALVARLLEDPRFRALGEIADIRWTVSFHRAGLRDRYVFRERPPYPGACPRKFLGGDRFSGNREVEAGRISWAGYWIDYDEARARADKNSFPPLALFEQPKVVVCQNASRARTAVDREGFVLKDTFLAIVAKPGQDDSVLDWISQVLNSQVFRYVYEHWYAGTRKGGGYLHFLKRYLDPFPIPPLPRVGASESVESMVEQAYGIAVSERNLIRARLSHVR